MGLGISFRQASIPGNMTDIPKTRLIVRLVVRFACLEQEIYNNPTLSKLRNCALVRLMPQH
jgi:hypothetical protein